MRLLKYFIKYSLFSRLTLNIRPRSTLNRSFSSKSFQGKLPPHLLSKYVFPYTGHPDRSVLVGPSLGVDAAVVDTNVPSAFSTIEKTDGCVAVTSDPITGSVNQLGKLIVTVNANDIAMMGATPRWMTLALLMPPNDYGAEAAAKDIGVIMKDIDDQCKMYNISVIGGHTEVTNVVNKPLAVSTCIGTYDTNVHVDASGAHVGDVIVMTKHCAIEGVSILASEYGEELTRRGVSKESVRKCVEEGQNTCVVIDADIAMKSGATITAMHDPTEGGLINALYELSDASKCSFVVDTDALRPPPHIAEVCRAVPCNPLHLISSGAALVCVSKESLSLLMSAYEANGMEAHIVGELIAREASSNTSGVDRHGKALERPEQDALWHALDSLSK